MVIKVLLIAFFLFAWSRALLRFRDGHITARELVLLSAFWFGATVVVIEPLISYRLALLLGVNRGADAVLYLTVAALCYFIFRIYIRIRNVEQEITRLVRTLALQDAEKAAGAPPPRPEPQPRADTAA